MSVATQDRSDTLHRILMAAEVEFAQRGFEGAGMKAISRRAEVSQALLHYHYGTKDHLYSEVVRTRAQVINAEREAMLDVIDLQDARALEQILAALFFPPLGPAGGDAAYARIFGGMVVGRERERALVREFYDPTARCFIAALQHIFPSCAPRIAALAYTFALGALVAVIGRDGRVDRLVGNAPADDDDMLSEALIEFTSAGIRGLVATQKPD